MAYSYKGRDRVWASVHSNNTFPLHQKQRHWFSHDRKKDEIADKIHKNVRGLQRKKGG